MNQIRAIAFYLPQYHPIPENDRWWGVGFTEWTNVVKAGPLFRGHYQPHLPADLGFYDLRLPEARAAQASLARAHGIHGFCYYHYWFEGRRLLERPFHDVLTSGQPDFPFCLCWANESWSRRWDGTEHEILMGQTYSAIDDRQHLRWLADAFCDPRYIRVNGRPLFLVYRSSRLPNPQRTIAIWREEAARLGLPGLYLCKVESVALEDRQHPVVEGFDAAVEFQPDWFHIGRPLRRGWKSRVLQTLGLMNAAYASHHVRDYRTVVQRMLRRPPPEYKRYPCVMPSWDNSPRRKDGAFIFVNSTPAAYEQWLSETIRRFTPYSAEENLIFINAWNEWAEGNHLEPDQRWGRGYLEATRRVLHAATARGTT